MCCVFCRKKGSFLFKVSLIPEIVLVVGFVRHFVFL